MNISSHNNNNSRGVKTSASTQNVEQDHSGYHGATGRERNHYEDSNSNCNRIPNHANSRSPRFLDVSQEGERWNLPAHLQRYGNTEDDEQMTSQELRKKTKELHQILNKRTRDTGLKTDMGVERHVLSPATRTVDSVTTATKAESVNGEVEKEKRFKHITLYPDHRSLSGNESSGVEICKKLFGITVFEYSNGKNNWNHMTKDRKLVVQGVVEGSGSHSSGRIHRGDMLVRINDVDVSWHNFTRLLASLNKKEKIKLTFQSPKIVRPKSSYSVMQVPESDLCLAVLGKRLAHIQSELSHIDCVALYLTLVPSSSEAETDEKEDIIYAFPPEEESLTALRGLFMTLSSALVDVVGQPASRTCLVLKDNTMNVVYKQWGSDVLVFAMPENRISVDALAAVLDAFISLMVLLFTDVKSAFSDCDRTWLDKVLALMFHQALSLHSFLPTSPSVIPAFSSGGMLLTLRDFHNVKVLNLSVENQLICDEILSEFEAMDFDDYLNPQDLFSRRRYTINGTGLFYKDHLMCSHLLPEQQREVNLFLNCHGLLALSSRQHVNQIMVWQELKSYDTQDVSHLPAGYRPSHSRQFLMIVGLNHFYLVVVIGAGGYSQIVQGQARPLPLLVDQGRATLAQLETKEVQMSKCCEDRLHNTIDSISLGSADQLCHVTSPRGRSSGRDAGKLADGQRLPLTPTKNASMSPFSRSKSVDRIDDKDDLNSAVVMRRQGSKLSYGSNDSAGSGSSTGAPKSKGSRVSSMADLSNARSLSVLHIDAPHDVIKSGRLARGKDNPLFNFVHLETGEGIIITPTDAELSEVHSSLQQQVMDNFCLACHKIREYFTAQTDKDAGHSLFRTSTLNEEGLVKEAGALFHCTFQSMVDKRHQVTTLQYWVIGRCWPGPSNQELYVCFHESASQSLVEMAFSLGFGT